MGKAKHATKTNLMKSSKKLLH